MRDFGSVCKDAGGGEGSRCSYPTRLDTYGCGCAHNCNYCYARSLLAFRGLWNPSSPAVGDMRSIGRELRKVRPGEVLRLGGMTDCLQPCEETHHITYKTLRLMHKRGIHSLVVTKSDLIASPLYMGILDPELDHIQITITSTPGRGEQLGEVAPGFERRAAAAERLQDAGFDVQVRVSPFIPEFIDLDELNSIRVEKACVEFLRVNTWVAKWMDIDLSAYTLHEGGYRHLPLATKRRLLGGIRFPQVTVCEDVPQHWEYWRLNQNPNKDDCCNLRL